MTLWAWPILGVYGLVLWFVSPRTRSGEEFFRGTDRRGREVGTGLLAASVLATWIFAKSVTNAANLGAAHGLVGGVAYAAWYLSIPFAAWILGGIRRSLGATSLAEFFVSRFGRAAAVAFLVAIVIRLYNEVWSNTVVVGTYFGPKGSGAFYAAAGLFTLVTLAYSLKGGLRSSILTDALQLGMMGSLIALVLFLVVPRAGVGALATSGTWTLAGGVDLVLVALLQVLSYPFHDPVLTDRAFIAPVPTVRRAFAWAGTGGIALIVLFSTVGIWAGMQGLTIADDAPRAAAAALGAGTLLAMNGIMMASAGSTLDSTFASLAKWTAADVPTALGRAPGESASAVLWGRIAMAIGALLGSLPLFTGAAILQATTISGTMVIGLAPALVLYRLRPAPPIGFHLAFWSGVATGVVVVLGRWPAALAVGDGPFRELLGANLWGLALALALYLVPWALAPRRAAGREPVVAET